MNFFDRGWMRYPHECAFGIFTMLFALFLGTNLYLGENLSSPAYHFASQYLYSHAGFWILHIAIGFITVFGAEEGISAYHGEVYGGSLYSSPPEDDSARYIMPFLMTWTMLGPVITLLVMVVSDPGIGRESLYRTISFVWPIALLPSSLGYIAHSVRIYRW
jgi:hypothetical protein